MKHGLRDMSCNPPAMKKVKCFSGDGPSFFNYFLSSGVCLHNLLFVVFPHVTHSESRIKCQQPNSRAYWHRVGSVVHLNPNTDIKTSTRLSYYSLFNNGHDIRLAHYLNGSHAHRQFASHGDNCFFLTP